MMRGKGKADRMQIHYIIQDTQVIIPKKHNIVHFTALNPGGYRMCIEER